MIDVRWSQGNRTATVWQPYSCRANSKNRKEIAKKMSMLKSQLATSAALRICTEVLRSPHEVLRFVKMFPYGCRVQSNPDIKRYELLTINENIDKTTKTLTIGMACPRSDYIYDDTTGRCHKKHDDAMTWDKASDTCSEDGGHLLTLDTAAEYNIILLLGLSQELWIGATDKAVEGEFRWLVSGDILPQTTPWNTNQPDGGDSEQCVTAFVKTIIARKAAPTISSEVKLNDAACTKILEFICEL
ncbi:lectin BRA-3-like [Ylistrum balloti]|uniref:lectin BRA-3-like n=1 Tax=Ylistrum balloti TaxID=509963 RepID=UPI002905CE84|nr:lectin BRA-3-like [Ylistrum balloti]